MPQSRQRRTSRTQPIDHRLVIATSLQEAATWIRQAEIAVEKLKGEKLATGKGRARQLQLDLEFLWQVSRNLKKIHNRYSRIKAQ
jgi:hypothetical protein